MINLQKENLAAEAELARQEEEKKLQAQKLESVSDLICPSLVAQVCTYVHNYVNVNVQAWVVCTWFLEIAFVHEVSVHL